MHLTSRLSQIAILSLLSGALAVGMPSGSVSLRTTPHRVAPHNTFVDLEAPNRVPGAQALAVSDRKGAAARARGSIHSTAPLALAPLTAPNMRVTGASQVTTVSVPVVVVGVTWQEGTGQGASNAVPLPAEGAMEPLGLR